MTLGDLVAMGLICFAVWKVAAFFRDLWDGALKDDAHFIAPLERERRFRVIHGGRRDV